MVDTPGIELIAEEAAALGASVLAGAMAPGTNVPGVRLVVVAGVPYQFVMVPMRAPLVIGWVLMGFPVSQALGDEFHSLLGVHLALLGLGLVFFGPEGYRAQGFSDARYNVGSLIIPGQAVWIVGLTGALMAGLFLFFERTLAGKALRATAVNRLGARLVGIATSLSGRIAFVLAGGIGALSGILIAPLTTVYYDSGFLVGLKGFVAAIIGGLVSYPLAALAAVLVGCVESLSSFYASAFKEVIVFTVIIPVLLWRSLRAPAEEE